MLIWSILSFSAHVSEEDIRMAEEKFEESKQLAETAMFNLLENDVSQILKISAHPELP